MALPSSGGGSILSDVGLPEALRQLTDRQWGLVTRAQSIESGLTPTTIAGLLTDRWRSILPGVFHTERSPLTMDQRCLAGLLYAGPLAALAGPSAARCHGLTQVDDRELVHVVVPAPLDGRRVHWLDIRRSRVPFGPLRTFGPLRVCSLDRAVVDVARRALTDEEAEAVIVESVQRRLSTLERLVDMNERLGQRGSARASRAIETAGWGVWSVPEAVLVRLAATSSVLPPIWCNPSLASAGGERLTTPDGWFDDVGLAVMVHSRTHHAGAGWQKTVEGDNQLIAQGVTVVPFTPASLRRAPEDCLATLEAAYLAAQRRGARPDIVATPQVTWQRA